MLRHFQRFITPNAKKSAVFYVGSFVSNIFNYLFHLMLLRLLAPEAYGEFLSYISFLYLITIPAETVSTLVTKYIASYRGRHDQTSIKRFFYLMLYRVVIPSAVLSLVIILASGFLASTFKAHPAAFVVLGVNIILTFFSAIVGSYLLAFQGYIFNVVASLIGIILKIAIAYGLVSRGSGALGGVIATFISGMVTAGIIFFKIKPAVYPNAKGHPKLDIKISQFFTYSFILSAGSLSLISSDVLLVRYFFPEHASGIYSALSVLARMIYFGLAPLSMLMIPIVASRFSAGIKTKEVLYKLSIAMLILGGIGTTIFWSAPDLVVRLLSGQQYQAVGSLLGVATLAMMLFSLSRLILLYFMSVGHQRANLFLLAALVAQPVLIFLFHQSLSQIIHINLIIQFCLLTSLLLYYRIALKQVI